MGLNSSRYLTYLLASSISTFLFAELNNSAHSASTLAAWELTNQGELYLRTSDATKLEAFLQYPEKDKGTRVWIDFPGELTRPRRILGNGPVKEVRLGKPREGFTRLVVEFNPSINFYPSNLKLVGTSPNLWKLKLVGLPIGNLRVIGEGNIRPLIANKPKNNITYFSFNSSDLPNVPKGVYRVVIDPGHGGPDPGAVGIGGVRETDVVLDISLRTARLLKAKGVKVNMTRSSEIDLDLPPRVALANRLKATAFISIHANATRNVRKDVNGIETFYFSGRRGLRLATNIQKELLRVAPNSPDRGVRRGRYFVIRRTSMPAALVEAGFLTGRFDGPLLAKSTYRRKISFAIAKGILNYLKEQN